jgi:uncharacterized damage-inducible protein DinB
MSLSQPILTELKQEAATTRKLFERLPESALSWRPHEKSMTMGHLAYHIATLVRWLNFILLRDDYDAASNELNSPEPDSVASLLEMFDQALAAASESLKQLPDEKLAVQWRFRFGEQVIMEMPRASAIRTAILNHLIHHRGQLSVYLRLQNIPLPFIYGPTADEGAPETAS